MGLPEGSFAVVVFIVLVLPGLIYGGVRKWARGESVYDRDLPISIARGAVFSIILTSIYFVTLGNKILFGLRGGEGDTVSIKNASTVGWNLLIFYLVIPIFLSVLLNWRHIEWVKISGPNWARWAAHPRSKHGYTSMPTAWDYAMRNHQHTFIKIQRADGQWVGGWFSQGSFASSYPEPRSIFIAEQWEMTEDGNFDKAIEGTGIYLVIGDGDLVIWVMPELNDSSEGNSREK